MHNVYSLIILGKVVHQADLTANQKLVIQNKMGRDDDVLVILPDLCLCLVLLRKLSAIVETYQASVYCF